MASVVQDMQEVIKVVAEEECHGMYKIDLDDLNDKEIERFWESVRVGPIQYGPIPLPRRKLVSKVNEKFRNDTDLKQTMSFSKSVTNTATLTWTVNAGIRLGAKALGVAIGLPYTAEGKVDVMPEISLGTTIAQTNTSTQTYSVNLPITVPPRECVTADLCVTEASYETDFTVEVVTSANFTFTLNATFDYWSYVGDAGDGGGIIVGGVAVGAVVGAVICGTARGGDDAFLALCFGLYGAVLGGFCGGACGVQIATMDIPKTKKVSFTAEDVFERLPGFWKDEEKGLVYCQVRGRFKGVHGVGVEVDAKQEHL